MAWPAADQGRAPTFPLWQHLLPGTGEKRGVMEGRRAAGRALAQLPQRSCRAGGPGEGQPSPRDTALCSHGSVPEQGRAQHTPVNPAGQHHRQPRAHGAMTTVPACRAVAGHASINCKSRDIVKTLFSAGPDLCKPQVQAEQR